MKRASNLKFVKQTKKARQYSCNGVSFWIPNTAVIELHKRNDGYTIIAEDWYKNDYFEDVSLLDIIDEVPPARIEYTTGISDIEFPEDLVKIQQEAVDFAVRLKYALVWLWTGSGKTKIAIEIANTLFKEGKIQRLYWITPPMGQEQIRSQFARWLLPYIEVKMVSINWFSYNVADDITTNDVVIIDEAHRVKNGIVNGIDLPDCQLAANVRQSISTAGYVYGLTATTCLNGALDLFGIFFALNKNIVVAADRKVKSYLNYKDQRPVGVKSLSELIKNISPYLFHRNKKDYDTREMHIREMPVKLSSEQSELMNRIYNMASSKFGKESIVETYTRMIRAMHRAGGSKKMEELLQVLQSIPNDEQVIIFGFTRNDGMSDIALITESVKQSGMSYITLHGGNSEQENSLAIDLFRKGKRQILIASYGCGAELLDFPNANHVVIFGHSLNPIHRYQGIGRIDRLTQQRKMNAYIIYAENSVEGYINHIYKSKTEFVGDLSEYFKTDKSKILNNELS